nr:cupin-like domain-containing protein [Chitinophaga sp. CF418]
MRNPDYEAFPALRHLNGWECTLHFGETLFIPSGYWHYIQYETAGYSVAYRALPVSMLKRAVGVRNIFITRRFDDAMRKILGKKWFDYKMKTAYRRAERAVQRKWFLLWLDWFFCKDMSGIKPGSNLHMTRFFLRSSSVFNGRRTEEEPGHMQV